MVKASFVVCLLLASRSSADSYDDVLNADDVWDMGINLLQLRASAAIAATEEIRMTANNTRLRKRDPSVNERELCPHEIEAAQQAQGDHRFGCDGSLKAQRTVQCSFWGEPHMTALFPNGEVRGWDVLYKTGHFRLAAAADGSWEVQLFNCGVYASAMAARFGKTLIESWIDSSKKIRYKVNGQETNIPVQVGEFFLDSTHRTIHMDHFVRLPEEYPGTCMNDPGGQVTIDVAQDLAEGNINLRIEAARDAVTTQATDSYSICNVAATGGENQGAGDWRWSNWPVQMVPTEKSLFTIGDAMCEGCQSIYKHWLNSENGKNDNGANGQAHCRAQRERQVGDVLVDAMCRENNIDVSQAAEACNHLVGNDQFFKDCQIDYCASGGQEVAALEAENEEAIENPQPVCVSGDGCDPASDCCGALRDQATLTLDNVVANDICIGGELRYGSALTQNGQIIDLVVKAVGLTCSGKLDASRFGSKNSQIGILSVKAGTSQEFEFTFVQHGTNNAVTPQSMMISFMDLDQGKNNKQRESVEICGAADAVMTDDTEIELTVNGNCVKATSTTHGNGRDNPDVLEDMSQSQRARTIAYKVTSSSFTATLGVSKKGHNPRRFNFAGNPTVACVLKA